MLRVTTAAADELRNAVRDLGLPDTFGVRLYGRRGPGGGLALALKFVAVPAEDDQVASQAGIRLFLAPEVAGALTNAALDIEQTSAGAVLVLKDPED